MQEQFNKLCRSGNLSGVKKCVANENAMLYIHYNDDIGFRYACASGKLDLVKYLIDYAESIGSPIDIHAARDHALRHALHKCDFELVKYLFDHMRRTHEPFDPHADEDLEFICMCLNNYNDLIGFLVDIDGTPVNPLVFDEIIEPGLYELIKHLSLISSTTETKYLRDADVGYIFNNKFNPQHRDVHIHDENLFKLIGNTDLPNRDFLDKNIHLVISKK